MRYPIVFILCSVLFSTSCLGQIRLDLRADAIPAALKSKANAVIRNSAQVVEFRDLENVVYRTKYSITILNSSGEEFATCLVYYDPSQQIKELKGTVYDHNGIPIAKIPESKFKDASAVSDFSLFEDSRVKWFSPSYSSYPFTVEYEIEQKFKNSMYFPGWHPQMNYNIAVEKSSYSFVSSEKYPIRIKERNYKGSKKESVANGLKTTSWETSQLQALVMEPLSPPSEEWFTKVEIAPEQFSYEKIRGSFSDWKDYGHWSYDNLLKGRDKVSNQTIATINDLVKDTEDPVARAKKIYEYVQSKTRYVSIQIGIGGFQPMMAEEVDRLGYGDCKALSNYTHSLLKIAGIQSHYAVLYGDEDIVNINKDFASAQGNHVILCVPFEKDTIWLECTNQRIPFGHLANFTDNRTAILCTEQGGVIARTRAYSEEENKIESQGLFIVDKEGTLDGKLASVYKGIFYNERAEIVESSGKKRTDLIAKAFPLNNLEVKKYNVSQVKTLTPETKEELEFSSRGYGSKSSTRLFLYLNKLKPFQNSLPASSLRANPIYIPRGYQHEDKFEYILPDNYEIELLPKSFELKTDFGFFTSTITFEGKKLIYSKKLVVKEGRYPKEKYKELYDFYSKVEASDAQKVVLISKAN